MEQADNFYLPFAILGVFAFLYSIFAGRLEKTPFSGPLIFIAFGILMGPLVLGWLELNISKTEFKVMADITLALLLFSDAANVNKATLWSSAYLPIRMLLLGLPGAIALGAIVAWVLFDQFTLLEGAILATMLAATDAALGKPVVTNTLVPARVRTALNVESGLNDGICVPILFLFIALKLAEEGDIDTTSLALTLVLSEIGIGALVGLSVTALGYWLVQKAWKAGWVTELWGHIPITMLPLICFAVAQSTHGSGYIAAFVGGLAFGYMARKRAHDLVLDAEGVGETLGMLTWVLFGSVVVVILADHFTWLIFLYAVLSLTLIRMLPVWLALLGTGESPRRKWFMAWFGPRGLASIVFAIIVLGQDIDNGEFYAVIVVTTVLLSAIIHGLTANPFVSALGAKTPASRKTS